MPNYTIYVSASNDAAFKAEDNKSGLINELLELHYGRPAPQQIQVTAVGHTKGELHYVVKKNDGSATPKDVEGPGPVATHPIPAEPAYVPGIQDVVSRKAETAKTCRNGHILASNGKCLQKGCKYA